MTDREAIRRITRAMIGHLIGGWDDESVVIEQLQYLLADLADPAAPTLPGVGPRDCPDDGTAMIQQRDSGWNCPRCHKHFPAAPTVTLLHENDKTDCADALVRPTACKCGPYDPCKEHSASTVTREQAEGMKETVMAWVHRNISIGYYPPHLPRLPDSRRWPAFFRAVADALEGK